MTHGGGGPANATHQGERGHLYPTSPEKHDDLSTWTGRWRFAYFTLGKLSPTTPEQAREKIGKYAEIEAKRVRYEGIECPVRRVESSQQPTEDYLWRGFRLSGKDLNIVDPMLTIVTTDCAGTPFAEFIQRKGELIFFVDGVFYFARPE